MMPRMIALKCPSCHGPLQVPDNRERFFYQFCGSPVVLADALGPGDAAENMPAPLYS